MFAFFLNILRQKSGRYVCVQLLQTLNILFENISHETSLCKYLYMHTTNMSDFTLELSKLGETGYSLSVKKLSLFLLCFI